MGATGPPAAAPVMVGPGPVPFPVMLGVDPGVMEFTSSNLFSNNFLNLKYYIDGSSSTFPSNGMV